MPPKQDVNAPDLYIPTMAVGTYCLLVCFASAAAAKFKPEVMTSAVRPCAVSGDSVQTLPGKIGGHGIALPSSQPLADGCVRLMLILDVTVLWHHGRCGHSSYACDWGILTHQQMGVRK